MNSTSLLSYGCASQADGYLQLKAWFGFHREQHWSRRL